MVLMSAPPTCRAVVALNVGAVAVPVKVGLAFGAYVDEAVLVVRYDPKVVVRLDDVM